KAGEEPPRLPVDMMRGTEVFTFGVSRAGNNFTVAESPLQRAENAQRMLAMGSSPEQVAVTFGVKKAQIDEWVSLLGLATPIQKAMNAGAFLERAKFESRGTTDLVRQYVAEMAKSRDACAQLGSIDLDDED